MNAANGLRVGNRISANFRGEPNVWIKGRIAAVRLDDTYDIKYDDGLWDPGQQRKDDFEQGVPRSRIRLGPAAKERAKVVQLKAEGKLSGENATLESLKKKTYKASKPDAVKEQEARAAAAPKYTGKKPEL